MCIRDSGQVGGAALGGHLADLQPIGEQLQVAGYLVLEVNVQ